MTTVVAELSQSHSVRNGLILRFHRENKYFVVPPFLRAVEESKLASLRQRLKSISGLSTDFVVLLAGSTLIATLGLFQNSPAVIIGAMIIAPLMRPLVALSLAILTGDTRLLGRAVLTLAIGTLVGVFISSVMALLFSALELTPEILGRTHPTLLDLGVAIFAGAVGAYCQTNEKLSESLAGVAISVALVPPLSVVGIGVAYGNWSVGSGAALLYATNLIGITVAGAIVFLILGFTPLHRAKKGLLVSGALSIMLIIPLALSMNELIMENQISITTKEILQQKTFTFKDVQLREVRVERFKKPMKVVATVLSPNQPITPKQVALVQDLLVRELGIPLDFKLQIIPSTQISGTIEPIPPTIEKPTLPAPTNSEPQQPQNEISPAIPIEQPGTQTPPGESPKMPQEEQIDGSSSSQTQPSEPATPSEKTTAGQDETTSVPENTDTAPQPPAKTP